MKLTDQEQVILKAISHVGRGGLAEVSKVIKAVNYPKATTKKVLVALAGKRAVSLHRHDWPQSLTPAQRKLMVLSKGHYYNAVSIREKNPKGKHLAGATAKQQKQYEAILKSIKASGRYKGREKEVAARTVRARAKNKSGKGKEALKTTGQALKKAASSVLGAGSQILGAGAKALNPSKKKRNAAKPSKTTYKAEIFDDGFKIHDNHGHRSKKIIYNSHSERITSKREARGQAAQFIKLLRDGVFTLENPKRARNASRTVHLTRKTKAGRARTSSKTGRKKTTARVRSVAKTRKAATRRVASNPRKGSRKKLGGSRRLARAGSQQWPTWSTSTLKAQRKDFEHALKWMGDKEPGAAARVRTKIAQIDAELQRRGSKKRKGNPSAESIRKTFAGSVNGERDLFFPQGTPQGLAKLGKLVSITTEEGTIKPVNGSAWLCADTKEKLHIGSTSPNPLFDGPKRSFGKVSRVEYEGSKPHLGYKGPIIWFHHMGEESGHRPTLHADGKGGLVFRGGKYRLTKRGIEN